MMKKIISLPIISTIFLMSALGQNKNLMENHEQYKKINQLIENNETLLNVTIYQRPQAESIILLHGGPGVPNEMKEVVNVLKQKYQVIYFEQRGTGNSTCNKCSYTMENYISDIDAIANYVQLDSFHLFGHSWGGLYAQIYADKKPAKVKSLFLCSPSSGTNKTWKETEREVFRFNKQIASTSELLKMGWFSMLGKFGSNRAYQKLFKQVYKNYHKGFLEYQIDEKELQKVAAKPVNKTRKEILKYKTLQKSDNDSFPICVTYGKKDIYGNSKREVISRYPTGQVHEIENCGHIPWLHNPKEFQKILQDFYEL